MIARWTMPLEVLIERAWSQGTEAERGAMCGRRRESIDSWTSWRGQVDGRRKYTASVEGK